LGSIWGENVSGDALWELSERDAVILLSLLTIGCNDTDVCCVSISCDICWVSELGNFSCVEGDSLRSIINAVAGLDRVSDWACWGLTVGELSAPNDAVQPSKFICKGIVGSE